jgi:D-aspartate ligase
VNVFAPPTGTQQRQPDDLMSPPAGALVVGADYRGLGLVRSLGRRGLHVWVLRDGGDDTLASKSRYAVRTFDLEGNSAEEQAAFLVAFGEEHGLEDWTLFPTSDETALMVSVCHERLAGRFRLTTPPWTVLRYAHDKRLTYRLAAELGIPHPRTWTGEGAPTQAALIDGRYPLIIKPAVKESFNRLTAAKAWRADHEEDLFRLYAKAAELINPEVLIVQEMIEGGGQEQLSYAALCEDGVPLAELVARRTRQYPADFGRASTFVETVSQPEIVGPSRLFLAEIGFTGLVEIEFKRDPRDGEFKLLDVNPRVWGWQSLCGRAGVDFPYLAFLLAAGESVPQSTAIAGVRWLRLSTDLPTSLKEIVRGRLPARAYLQSLRGPRESAIFARDDPLPGLVEFPSLVRTLARRLSSGDAV